MADTDGTKLSDGVAAVANNLGVEYVISFRFTGSGVFFSSKPNFVDVRLIEDGYRESGC